MDTWMILMICGTAGMILLGAAWLRGIGASAPADHANPPAE